MAVIGMNSPEEMGKIVADLKACSEAIGTTWNNVLQNEVANIKDSWVGAAASKYTDNLTNMDSDVKSTLEVLSALADAFNQAKTEIEAADADVSAQM